MKQQLQQQVQQWWGGLQPREQSLVLLCAIAIGVFLFYYLIWQPVHQSKARNQQALMQAEQQLDWLHSVLPQLQQAGTGVERSSGSLSQVLTTSARQHGIRVSRMQPQNQQMQLVLDDVAFESLVRWLHALHYQHGLQLVNLDVSAASQPGVVQVRRILVE
ncbi:type II secretion system protein M [Alkalimonas delamerensis]|uniref:Type II secretion system protein M n=1 Tax=Alkalimonas delamerensis TaxID=265981 RepID=A0ABT9GTT5_9GAMM|nr:type II secretion system protein M [Alkalimonas delamerensis]MDP4530352.1 type II secretion system protein M [Alkalimonas delamerensis]